MRGSLLAAVFIPCLQNTVQVVENDLTDLVQFLRREPVVGGQDEGFQPEFTDSPAPRTWTCIGSSQSKLKKEESIRTRYTSDRRQGGYLHTASPRPTEDGGSRHVYSHVRGRLESRGCVVAKASHHWVAPSLGAIADHWRNGRVTSSLSFRKA